VTCPYNLHQGAYFNLQVLLIRYIVV